MTPPVLGIPDSRSLPPWATLLLHGGAYVLAAYALYIAGQAVAMCAHHP